VAGPKPRKGKWGHAPLKPFFCPLRDFD